MNEGSRRFRLTESRVHDLGLLAGPLIAVAVYVLLGNFQDLGEDGRRLAAVGTLMAVWWVSEAIPLAATALVPIVLFPALQIVGITDTGARYGHPLIFLFMGGLMLGKGLERWGAHNRMALWIIMIVGVSPRRIVAGVMIAAAVLSAFVSNTATAMMMLPIVASIGKLASGEKDESETSNLDPADDTTGDDEQGQEKPDPKNTSRFHTCLLLALAYGCSIGGIATIMGTPPNGFMAGFLKQQLDIDMSYARWLGLGVPLTVVLLPLAWAYLVYLAMSVRIKQLPGGKEHIRKRIEELGRMEAPEMMAVGVFALTALAWVTHGWIEDWLGLPAIDDGAIAIAGAMLMFALPAGRDFKTRLLSWEQAEKIPWGILILFGGGLALAQGVTDTGFDKWIGQQIASLGNPGELSMLAGTSTLIIFLTEITSNTATTSTMLPVLAAAADSLGISASKLVIIAAVSASCAFMLPVATPPNAIVFSTGRISIRQMAAVGFGLNIIAIVVITLMVWLLANPLLSLDDQPAATPEQGVSQQEGRSETGGGIDGKSDP
ncbi:MAG: SLC13 family permease [Phycisphaerales bacterium]